jgi:tubulin polyglutamylase TTLL6/13
LIEGLKFDLRLYVLMTCCDPLRLFLYPDGLVRFATELYEQPKKKNLKNLYMHLTNYSINKFSEKFEFNKDQKKDDVGHKRSVLWLMKFLKKQGKDTDRLWANIKDLIIKTMCAGLPGIATQYRLNQPNDFYGGICFEVLGYSPRFVFILASTSFSIKT